MWLPAELSPPRPGAPEHQERGNRWACDANVFRPYRAGEARGSAVNILAGHALTACLAKKAKRKSRASEESSVAHSGQCLREVDLDVRRSDVDKAGRCRWKAQSGDRCRALTEVAGTAAKREFTSRRPDANPQGTMVPTNPIARWPTTMGPQSNQNSKPFDARDGPGS